MYKSVKSMIFVCVFILTAVLPIPASAATSPGAGPIDHPGNQGQLIGTGLFNGYGGGYYGYSIIPTFYINSVARDVSVTITTCNFPTGDSFDVLMNVIGTQGPSDHQLPNRRGPDPIGGGSEYGGGDRS